jgi:hypothetical protein
MVAVPTDTQDQQPVDRDTALRSIEGAISAAPAGPPLERWNPPFLGDIDMRIAADGTWYYMSSPIRRERLVRLFSSILRREEDGRICLVTPVEKFAICVDDAPFLAVEMSVAGQGREQIISFRTSVDDDVRVDRDHPMRFAKASSDGEVRPYVTVRAGLEALIVRAVFYDLVDLGTVYKVGGDDKFGVWSCGEFFAMADAAGLDT